MFGVHGNGLTHLIAMAPRPISTVIEIFYPGRQLHYVLVGRYLMYPCCRWLRKRLPMDSRKSWAQTLRCLERYVCSISPLLPLDRASLTRHSYFTSPNLPSVAYPEGFQGTEIPVYGPTVAALIEERVEGRLPDPPLPCPKNYCAFRQEDIDRL